MIILDEEEMKSIQRVKAVSIDALQALGVEATQGTLGIAEVMLEICDENLELMVSEAEVRLLAEIHDRLHSAQPFAGLHEALAVDCGLDLFFSDLRMLVTILDPIQRAHAWKELFMDFASGCRHHIYALTPWVSALRKYGEDHLTFWLQMDMMAAKQPGRLLQ